MYLLLVKAAKKGRKMSKEKNTGFSLPFGIDFVISEDLANEVGFRTWKASGSSYDITCPFCGGKRKMNINTAKNVAKCNKCGCGNGYNTITLHAALTGLSNSESFKDLMKRWKGLDSDVKLNFTPKAVPQSGIEPAPIEIRDKVYRRFLEKLALSDKHTEDLLKRGLTYEQIKKGLYKSVPVVGLHSLAYDAVYASGAYKDLENHKYWGIPGFTDVKDPRIISVRGRKPGYFIPVIQKDGLISGMQIRYDAMPEDASESEKELYKKYSWYSSSEKETGCSVTGCENIHFAGTWKRIPKTINITEGVLKADIASALSGKPFLGLVGVSNTGQLEQTLVRLQYLGAESVNLYIDMDYRSKKEVASALLAIRKIVNSAGRHSYTLLEGEGFEVRPFSLKEMPAEGFKKGLKIISPNEFPKTALLIIGKTKIPESAFWIQKNELQIEYEYVNCIKNGLHTLRIFDASKGYENWGELTGKERQKLFEETAFSKITFSKSGLTYSEMNWNDKYKGIDDYYLYLQSINSQEDI